MRRWIRARPSPAMIVALLALLLALGGTTYALTIPRKSVGPKQLKKNAVTKKKIKSKAVDRSKIKDDAIDSSKVEAGSLLANDLGAGQLPTAAFASDDPADIALPTSTFTKVIGLTSGTNSGLLTTGVSARVIATASLNVFNTGGGGASTIVCKLQLAPQGGAFADISQLGRVETTAVSQDMELTQTGATDVGPGTYDVQAVCTRGGDVAAYDTGNITAVAVGR